MESNWCFPNKRKILNEEQKNDKNDKTKLREKENETASSRLNEEQKNDENNSVESNWCFPNKRKILNEEQKNDKNDKTKLREKENERGASERAEPNNLYICTYMY